MNKSVLERLKGFSFRVVSRLQTGAASQLSYLRVVDKFAHDLLQANKYIHGL